MFNLFVFHTSAETHRLLVIGAVSAGCGLFLAFGLELSGQSMNWFDRIGAAASLALPAILVASVIMNWRK